jgi:hypothetical protein
MEAEPHILLQAVRAKNVEKVMEQLRWLNKPRIVE